VVIGYDDQFKAEEVRLKLWKMQKDYLIDMEDAVVAVKDQKGKVRLHQAVNLTAAGAVSGGFWGSLIGLIFLNPILGMAVGAASGAVSGALTDVGLDDKFMKELAADRRVRRTIKRQDHSAKRFCCAQYSYRGCQKVCAAYGSSHA
jgi:uncharacterized membrane protein